jgi:hypothetical protein
LPGPDDSSENLTAKDAKGAKALQRKKREIMLIMKICVLIFIHGGVTLSWATPL